MLPSHHQDQNPNAAKGSRRDTKPILLTMASKVFPSGQAMGIHKMGYWTESQTVLVWRETQIELRAGRSIATVTDESTDFVPRGFDHLLCSLCCS